MSAPVPEHEKPSRERIVRRAINLAIAAALVTIAAFGGLLHERMTNPSYEPASLSVSMSEAATNGKRVFLRLTSW